MITIPRGWRKLRAGAWPQWGDKEFDCGRFQLILKWDLRRWKVSPKETIITRRKPS